MIGNNSFTVHLNNNLLPTKNPLNENKKNLVITFNSSNKKGVVIA